MKTKKSFSEIYSFPGFRAKANFKKGILGDPKARIVELVRRQKKRFVQPAANHPGAITINVSTGSGTSPAEICGSIWNLNIAELTVNIARP
jgi:hypothetical protein